MPAEPCPVWKAPYRPLFLCAGLWAIVAPSVWLWPGYSDDPVFWHLHELMFGMAGAAVGGYLLTALPNWTGRTAGQVRPRQLQGLVLLWAVARLGLPMAGVLPHWALVPVATGYFLWLSCLLVTPILAARAWSRLPLAAFPLVLAVADTVFLLLGRAGGLVPQAALLMALAYALLIGGVGARALPAFADSWLELKGSSARVRAWPGLTWLAGFGNVAGAALAVSDHGAGGGIVLVLTGCVQILRLAGWQPRAILGYPALVMLYAAWMWLGVGLIFAGVALIWPATIPVAAALHALMIGAVGTMILSIAGRPAMRRSRGMLIVPETLLAAFVLVSASAILRITAPFTDTALPDPIRLSAASWMAGWILFLIGFRRGLRGTVPHPALSARKPGSEHSAETSR